MSNPFFDAIDRDRPYYGAYLEWAWHDVPDILNSPQFADGFLVRLQKCFEDSVNPERHQIITDAALGKYVRQFIERQIDAYADAHAPDYVEPPEPDDHDYDPQEAA